MFEKSSPTISLHWQKTGWTVWMLSLVCFLALLASACGSTPAPSSSPSVTPVPTDAVPIPSVTPPPTESTPDIAATVIAASQPQVHSPLISPDGQWQAEVTVYDCVQVGELDSNAYEELEIVGIEDGTRQVVDYQLLSCGGLGAFGLEALFWSSNSRYLYYTDAREGVPDGGCGGWERPFIRLDTADWTTEYLGGGPLSPDGSMIATWQRTEQGQELVVWDMDQGEIARTEPLLPNLGVGSIEWAPGSQELAYLQGDSFCPPQGASNAVLLNPSDMTITLIEFEPHVFSGLAWDDQEHLRLFDIDDREWIYDLVTRDLTPLNTSIPSPTTTTEPSCEHEWFLDNPPSECAGEEPIYSLTVAQRFEHGLLLWREQPDYYGSQIYAFFDDSQWPQWNPTNDRWHEGLPESDPSIVPPPGLYQPVRGFGMFWRDALLGPSSARARLGWALEEEHSLGELPMQCSFGDEGPSGCFVIGPEQTIYYIYRPNNVWSIWADPLAGLSSSDLSALEEPLLIDGERGWIFGSAQVDGVSHTVKLATDDGRLLAAYAPTGRLALDRTHNRLVVDQGEAGLTLLDSQTGDTISSIALPVVGPAAADPQVDPSSGLIYAFRDRMIYVVDPDTEQVVQAATQSIPVSVCNEPGGDAAITGSFYDLTSNQLYLTFLTYVCTPWLTHSLVAYDAVSLTELGRYQTASDYQAVPYSNNLYGTTATRLGRGASWAWSGSDLWFEEGDSGHRLQGMVADWGRGLIYEALDDQIWTITPYPRRVVAQTDISLLTSGSRLVGHDPISDNLYFLTDGRLDILPTTALSTGLNPATSL